MNTVTFKVEGMYCDGCAATVQALLERNAGVKKATASFEEREARVLYDPRTVAEEQLIALIEQGSYRVAGEAMVETDWHRDITVRATKTG